jgi:hypothetical protein
MRHTYPVSTMRSYADGLLFFVMAGAIIGAGGKSRPMGTALGIAVGAAFFLLMYLWEMKSSRACPTCLGSGRTRDVELPGEDS